MNAADQDAPNRQLDKVGRLTIFLRLFVPAAILLLAGMFFYGQGEIERELTRLRGRETVNVGLGAGVLSRNLDDIARDLHFLEGHSALRQAVDVPTPQHIGHLAADFLNFSKSKGIYDQVRWIDETGMEIVRIDQVQGRSVVISADKLQNKGQRYFFTDTIKLKPGEIFVSPLDLNIEQDKVEVPHKPMVRVATPLTDSRGARRGIVILNYHGRVMLDSFAETTTDIADHVMVVNRNGYWLKSPKTDEEWGFMFNRTDLTLAARAPRAWASIRSADKGQEILSDGLWTWESVHPLLAGQKSSTGTSAAFAPSRGAVEAKQYVWKVAAHTSLDTLSALQQATWLKLSGVVAMLLGLLGAGSWKLASAWVSLGSSEQEVRKLNAGLEQKVDQRTRELADKVAALDTEIAERRKAEAEIRRLNETLEATNRSLIERTKELRCRYAVSSLVASADKSVPEMLEAAVHLISPGWVYPEIARARIIFNDREFTTDDFRETPWKQSADIVVNEKTSGRLELVYLEERPAHDEGPFLKEEKVLIENLALILGAGVERKHAEETLRRQNAELTLFNTAGVDRELVMIDLKQQVNALSRQLGQKEPYDVSFAAAPPKDRS